jgi:putative flippase GtrA
MHGDRGLWGSMFDKLRRLWRLYHTPAGRKMYRYTAVSIISTIVSFIVLTLVYGVLRLWSEVPSVLFANVVAGIVSYNLNRRWAWGKKGRSHLTKEVLPFWMMSLAGMILSLFAAAGAHNLVKTHHIAHLPATALVLASNVAAWGSLWVIKFLVFNRLFRTTPAQVPSELVDAETG